MTEPEPTRRGRGQDEAHPGPRNAAIDGADAAAIGTGPAPTSAPDGAVVDDSEHLVPGAGFDAIAKTQSKPWFTSLAAESDQAGVANDEPDAQGPQLRDDADPGRQP